MPSESSAVLIGLSDDLDLIEVESDCSDGITSELVFSKKRRRLFSWFHSIP